MVALGHSKILSEFDGVLDKADINDPAQIREIILRHKITQIYHLAALLSATGEQYPDKAWEVNLLG